MAAIDGFDPIVSNNAKVLILGSMPGEISLLKQQYYAHPRNAFWPIMAALFGLGVEDCYQRRKEILMANGVAVWDVLQSCNRLGSLDAKIQMESIKINDLVCFFARYGVIRHVFFNGGMAEKVYRKYVLPEVTHRFDSLRYHRLPSTSPAYASVNLEQKIEAWKVIRQDVVK
ncbi:MAG: DNA-deoxyinosine glycosylase [Methylococcaceae bacterium]